MSARKQVLLRVDPAVHDALMRWANDELRSVNAQIEVLLRRALTEAGRMPRHAAPLPKRGRPELERRLTGRLLAGPRDRESDITVPAIGSFQESGEHW